MKRIKERFDPNGHPQSRALRGGYLMSARSTGRRRRGAARSGAPPRKRRRRSSRPSTTTSSPAASAASASLPAPSSGPPGARPTWPGARWPCSATSWRTAPRSAPTPRTPSPTACSAGPAPRACFSAVKTDKVVISFRHAYADRFGRGLLQRGGLPLPAAPAPADARAGAGPSGALRRTGLPDLARRAGLIGLLNPKLERAMELREGTPGPLLTPASSGAARPRRAGALPAPERRRGRRPPRGLLDVLRLQLRAARGRGGHRQRARSAWATGWRSSTTAAAAWPPTATATWTRPPRPGPREPAPPRRPRPLRRHRLGVRQLLGPSQGVRRAVGRTTRNGPQRADAARAEDAQLQRVRPGDAAACRPSGRRTAPRRARGPRRGRSSSPTTTPATWASATRT